MEIERKFLVKNLDFKKEASPLLISQGYLNSDKNRTVRVRIHGDQAFLTIKSITSGISREEYEYGIPLQDAKELIHKICEKPIIEKLRYKIDYKGKTWEVDEFLGDNSGLVVAEIELGSESESFEKPDWIDKEVSSEAKYFNSSLVKNPYRFWDENQ